MDKAQIILEVFGQSFDVNEIYKKVKEDWVSKGNLVKDLKDARIYIKPEDNAAYYVVKEETYSVSLS